VSTGTIFILHADTRQDNELGQGGDFKVSHLALANDRRLLLIAGAMIAGGIALVTWAFTSAPQLPSVPYELQISAAPSDAPQDVLAFGIETEKLNHLELRATGFKKPIATAFLTQDDDGRFFPLSWQNSVMEPIFFSDLSAFETMKVLTAIKDHVPRDAVILSWWDLSRKIRKIAQRQAPLDDPLARGLLAPSAWSSRASLVSEDQRNFWSAGVPVGDGAVFAKFADALLLDEDQGAQALAEIAGVKPVYVAVHLYDIWKTAATRPDQITLAYRDFPGTNESHGVFNSVHQWIQEQKIEGGYAVEPIGSAMRLHYLPRKSDSERLIAQLLPFSTSNPLRLRHLHLVYQHKGYWIYELRL